LSTLSAVEQMAQQIASDTPTMPQWALIVMAGLLVFTARQKMRAAK
jgi:hypothetical protein